MYKPKPELSIKLAIIIVVLVVAALTVMSLALHGILLGVINLMDKNFLDTFPFEIFPIISLCSAVLVDTVAIFVLRRKFEIDLKKQFRRIDLSIALLFFLLVFFIFSLIIPFVNPWQFISKLSDNQLIFHSFNSELFSSFSIYNGIDFFIGILIIPVVEEIIYRGIIFNQLLKRYSVGISIFVSSLLFALMHLRFAGIAYLFLYGLLLSFAYYRTKSILTPIVLHIFINLMAHLTKNQFIQLNSANSVKYFLFFIVATACAVLFFLLINKGEYALKINRKDIGTELKHVFSKKSK